MDNRGGNNFLLGVIIGAAAVFLLGTDKGRKVLKEVTGEGLEGLSDILERAEEEIVQNKGLEPKPQEKEGEDTVEEELPETNGESNVKKSPAKRFFRRPKS